MYLIYKITCPSSAKFYIGKTRQEMRRRWTNHVADANGGTDTHFKRAIRKYGRDSFVIEELAWASENEQAIWLEKHFIRFSNSNDSEIGYNSTIGGDGVSQPSGETLRKMIEAGRRHKFHTEEAKAKISAAGRGRKISDETRERMRLAATQREHKKRLLRPPPPPKVVKVRVISEAGRERIIQAGRRRRGIKLSEEHKRKISDGLRGRECSQETRLRLSRAHKGKPGTRHTEEAKRKISEGLKGIRRSEETRRKLSLARRSRNKGQIMADSKNSLVGMSDAQRDPYRVTGSDFPSPGGAAVGESSGQDELTSQSDAQESPRAIESESADGPAAWGKGGTAFKVSRNTGETGTSVGASFGVDFSSGQSSPNVSTERT